MHRTALEERARLMRIDQHADDMAHNARAIIEAMPDRLENLQLMLETIEQRMAISAWADFSLVIERLQAASAALDEVTAYDYEDMAKANAEDLKFQQHRDDAFGA